jgi:hypothetical protein
LLKTRSSGKSFLSSHEGQGVQTYRVETLPPLHILDIKSAFPSSATRGAGLKIHLHKIFDLCFFSSIVIRIVVSSPYSYPKFVLNIKSTSWTYSNLKLILRIIRIRETMSLSIKSIKRFCSWMVSI